MHRFVVVDPVRFPHWFHTRIGSGICRLRRGHQLLSLITGKLNLYHREVTCGPVCTPSTADRTVVSEYVEVGIRGNSALVTADVNHISVIKIKSML